MLGPYQALLFDMDGTLLTSGPSIDRAWRAWAERQGLPADEVVAYLRGRRASDAIAHFLPDLSPEQLRQEIDWVESVEMSDTADVSEVPGAATFLMSLPGHRWAVATSAARRLAASRIAAAGLPAPPVLIGAEDVAIGKPDPSGYLLAAERLGVDPSHCLVFEDAPNGVAAGLASRAAVAVVAPSGEANDPAVALVFEDYRGLTVDVRDGGLCIGRR